MTKFDMDKFIYVKKEDIPSKKALLQAELRLKKDAAIYSKGRFGTKEGFDSDTLFAVASFMGFLAQLNLKDDAEVPKGEIDANTQQDRLCAICSGEGHISYEAETIRIKEIEDERIAHLPKKGRRARARSKDNN